MFRGATKVTLDDKGRLVVPVRHRVPLLARSPQGDLVVTLDRTGKCLLIYAQKDWEIVEAELIAMGNLGDRPRRLQTLLMGNAVDIVMDAHGRLLLTQELRESAGIQRLAMFVGQGKRCELWDESRWMQEQTRALQAEAAATDIPPELSSFSL